MRFADKTAIYIPLKFTGIGKAAENLAYDITRAVGGVSITEVRGGYVMADDTLYYERMCKYEWWHRPQEPAMIYIAKIARHLIENGEEAVLVEFTRSGVTTAQIWDISHVSEQDDD